MRRPYFFFERLRSLFDFACSSRGGEIIVGHQWRLAMNALNPAHMTAAERLAELGDLLGAGLIRLHARKSSRKSADFGESSVDLGEHQSGHADPNFLEIKA